MKNAAAILRESGTNWLLLKVCSYHAPPDRPTRIALSRSVIEIAIHERKALNSSQIVKFVRPVAVCSRALDFDGELSPESMAHRTPVPRSIPCFARLFRGLP
jgi:hypothetical protein